MNARSIILSAFAAAAALAPLADAQRGADPRVETMARMMRPVTLELTDTPIGDVLTFIEQVGGVTLEVMSQEGGVVDGVDLEQEISVTMRGGTLLRLLERSLDKAETGFADYEWQLTEYGEIEVGPKSALNRARFLKIYDVRDLLFEIPSFTDAPTLDLDSVLGQAEGGGGGGSIFEDEEAEGERETEQQRLERITDIITTTVESEQWQINGGDGASLREYNGTLLINAPDYIHRQIDGYDFWPAVERAARRYRDAQALPRDRRRDAPRSAERAGTPTESRDRAARDEEPRSPVDDLTDAVDGDEDRPRP